MVSTVPTVFVVQMNNLEQNEAQSADAESTQGNLLALERRRTNTKMVSTVPAVFVVQMNDLELNEAQKC